MDLRGVVRAFNDGVEIHGIWLGTTFVWPDPWMDTWDEGIDVIWESTWRDAWSIANSTTSPIP